MPDILVVDNDSKGAACLRAMLEKAGATVVVCLSGAAAFSLLQTQTQGFEAAFILWDVAGPPAGLELMVRLRARWPDLPIFALSDRFTAEVVLRADNLVGCQDWLRKPIEEAEFLKVWQQFRRAPSAESEIMQRLRARIWGESPKLLAILREVEKLVLKDEGNVLLLGETGTGKSELARAMHDAGPRRARGGFCQINLRATAPTLVEADLFGVTDRTFTGVQPRTGVLEAAGGGTVFIDEVGELSEDLQVKLLQVVENRRFTPLGTSREVTLRARLIFATNKDLPVEQSFRRDLFYRIAGTRIDLPPLRERKDDVPLLLRRFLAQWRGDRAVEFAPSTWEFLCDYSYPGNVRELMSLVEGALTSCEGNEIRIPHLKLRGAATPEKVSPSGHDWLVSELGDALPADWSNLTRDAALRPLLAALTRAFDRVYLPQLRQRYAKLKDVLTASGIKDSRTFWKHWEAARLPLPENFEENKEE
jgi:DNA-binding NtrC family response regulator